MTIDKDTQNFDRQTSLLLQAAKTDEGIRTIMECMPGSKTDKLIFDTLKKYRTDGPMLAVLVAVYSIRPKETE